MIRVVLLYLYILSNYCRSSQAACVALLPNKAAENSIVGISVPENAGNAARKRESTAIGAIHSQATAVTEEYDMTQDVPAVGTEPVADATPVISVPAVSTEPVADATPVASEPVVGEPMINVRPTAEEPEKEPEKVQQPKQRAVKKQTAKKPATVQSGQKKKGGLLYYRKWWERRTVQLLVNGNTIHGTPIFVEDDTLRVINDEYSYFVPLAKVDYIRTDDGLKTSFEPIKKSR